MRTPNPWIAIPSLLAGGLGSWVGWVATDVSCRVKVEGVVTSCPWWSLTMAVIGGLVGLLGMGTVLVLVYRSIAEARAHRERGLQPPGPGCETGRSATDPNPPN